MNRLLAKSLFDKWGLNLVMVNNGKELLNDLNTNSYDIILMDIQMPEMDGIEAMQKIRNDFKELPPIVALSANALEGDEQKYMEKGFDGYMAKPITTDALKRFLAQYL